MKKIFACMSAVALVSTLTACGSTDEPANEVVANDQVAAATGDTSEDTGGHVLRAVGE